MLCPICNELELDEYDNAPLACINCVMTGRQMEFFLLEPIRNEVLRKIRELPNVVTAYLWPTDRSTWTLGVMLTDGRLVNPLAVVPIGLAAVVTEEETITEPLKGVLPMIPPKGSNWKMVVSTKAENGGWNPDPEVIEDEFSDAELPEAIAALG